MFALATIHAVEAPAEAAEFFENVLSFEVGQWGNHYVAKNGAMEVRLVKSSIQLPASELRIDVRCRTLDGATAELCRHGAISRVGVDRRVSEFREERELRGPFGLLIVLSRHYDEDELGLLPELPADLDWQEDADGHLRHILREIPLAFRDQARLRITREAEARTLARGQVQVQVPDAMEALVACTPTFQHAHLRNVIAARGIEAGRWFDA